MNLHSFKNAFLLIRLLLKAQTRPYHKIINFRFWKLPERGEDLRDFIIVYAIMCIMCMKHITLHLGALTLCFLQSEIWRYDNNELVSLFLKKYPYLMMKYSRQQPDRHCVRQDVLFSQLPPYFQTFLLSLLWPIAVQVDKWLFQIWCQHQPTNWQMVPWGEAVSWQAPYPLPCNQFSFLCWHGSCHPEPVPKLGLLACDSICYCLALGQLIMYSLKIDVN